MYDGGWMTIIAWDSDEPEHWMPLPAPPEKRKATTVSDTEILIALFSLRAALHRGSESGEYFFSVFGKPASPKTFKTILEAARHACDALGMLPPPPEKPTGGGGR
jgi:hypothetical protein